MRHIFSRKPCCLKTRKTARPELSGPRDTKKEALIPRAARISRRAGTPCRNPSRVSTSTFNPNRDGKLAPWWLAEGASRPVAVSSKKQDLSATLFLLLTAHCLLLTPVAPPPNFSSPLTSSRKEFRVIFREVVRSVLGSQPRSCLALAMEGLRLVMSW